MAKLKLYLDNRKQSKDNTYPLVIALTNKSTTVHIPLSIRLQIEQWKDSMIVNHPQKKALNNLVSLKLSELQVRLMSAENDGLTKGKTASEIKVIITKSIEENTKIETETTFSSYYDIFISRKSKLSTIESYNYTYERLKKYTDINSLFFSDITVSFLRDFDIELSKTCSINTKSIHFRNIRAIFNAAIDEEVIPQDCYPFRRFKIKSEKTQKRSLTVNELRTLRDYPCEEHQKLYRDIFMLSFYLAGINMVDLINLPALDKSNQISYKRSKTGIFCQLEVPSIAFDIINKYKGEAHLIYIGEKYANHKDFIHRINLNLQQIGEVIYKEEIRNNRKFKKKEYKGLFPALTSYWARHTWATIAADIDIPDAIIDMALGHKSPYPMSDIYIRRNLKKVNEAVRKVIDYVNEIPQR